MKSFFQLIVVKNWRTYVSLFALFLVLGGLLKIVVAEQNQLLKLPVAIQDLDHSPLSRQFVSELKKQPRFAVDELPETARYVEDEVTKQRAVAVLIIPKDYAKRMTTRRTSDLLTLYVQHTIVGDIVTETISKTAYKQQLPFLVATHLQPKDIALETIWTHYEKIEPAGQLTMRSVAVASPQSLRLTVIVVVMLLVGVVQVGLNRTLCQPHALARIRLYEADYRKFYSVYMAAHSLTLIGGASCMMWLVGLSWSFPAVMMLFLLALLFELGVALLLVYVRTWSHQLFMAFIWAMTLAALWTILQLGGIV